MSLAELQAEALDSAELLELFVLPHPLAGIEDAELEERMVLAEQLIAAWLERLEEEGAWKPT